jgi:hypothetical protein
VPQLTCRVVVSQLTCGIVEVATQLLISCEVVVV